MLEMLHFVFDPPNTSITRHRLRSCSCTYSHCFSCRLL